jgi:hypothetical protein
MSTQTELGLSGGYFETRNAHGPASSVLAAADHAKMACQSLRSLQRAKRL